jgi:hypothetical protein
MEQRELGDLAKVVEQLQNKLVELEDRLLKMAGEQHLMVIAYQQLRSPVNFTVLDRLDRIEARLDSIAPLPPR